MILNNLIFLDLGYLVYRMGMIILHRIVGRVALNNTTFYPSQMMCRFPVGTGLCTTKWKKT